MVRRCFSMSLRNFGNVDSARCIDRDNVRDGKSHPSSCHYLAEGCATSDGRGDAVSISEKASKPHQIDSPPGILSTGGLLNGEAGNDAAVLPKVVDHYFKVMLRPAMAP